MKKIWLILLCLAALLILLYLLWSASGYLLSEQEQSKPELPREVTLIHSDPPGIGEIVPVRAEFKLPRYREILHISVTPGKGTVVSRSAEAKKIKRSWKYDFYRLEGFICCIRPGESKTGSITVELSPAQKGAAPEKFLLTIPALKIKELPPWDLAHRNLLRKSPCPRRSFPGGTCSGCSFSLFPQVSGWYSKNVKSRRFPFRSVSAPSVHWIHSVPGYSPAVSQPVRGSPVFLICCAIIWKNVMLSPPQEKRLLSFWMRWSSTPLCPPVPEIFCGLFSMQQI